MIPAADGEFVCFTVELSRRLAFNIPSFVASFTVYRWCSRYNFLSSRRRPCPIFRWIRWSGLFLHEVRAEFMRIRRVAFTNYTRSYGPTNDFYFKPAVPAPGKHSFCRFLQTVDFHRFTGGNMYVCTLLFWDYSLTNWSSLSTLPVPLGGYVILSGTSSERRFFDMSCTQTNLLIVTTPFMAGSSALLLSIKGKSQKVTNTARTLFETTAQTLSSSHTDGDPLQTVTQQGAGLVNVFNAIHTTTLVSPGEFILNDTAHFNDR